MDEGADIKSRTLPLPHAQLLLLINVSSAGPILGFLLSCCVSVVGFGFNLILHP
jgi:hypothetical protein